MDHQQSNVSNFQGMFDGIDQTHTCPFSPSFDPE